LEEEDQMERATELSSRPGGCLFTLSLNFLRFCAYVFTGTAVALFSLDVTITCTIMPQIFLDERRLGERAAFVSLLVKLSLPLIPLIILTGAAFLLREYLLAGRPPFREYVRFVASAWPRRTKFRTSCDAISGFVLLLSELFFGAIVVWTLIRVIFAYFDIPASATFFAKEVVRFVALTPLLVTILAAFLLRHNILVGKRPRWAYVLFVMSAFVAMIVLCWRFKGDEAYPFSLIHEIRDWWYYGGQWGGTNGLYSALLHFVVEIVIPLVICIPPIGATLLHWRFARNKKETE
jgi:hypothetical protein